jgi:hypothetical protein
VPRSLAGWRRTTACASRKRAVSVRPACKYRAKGRHGIDSSPHVDAASHEVDAAPFIIRPVYALTELRMSEISRPKSPGTPASTWVLCVEGIHVEIVYPHPPIHEVERSTLAKSGTKHSVLICLRPFPVLAEKVPPIHHRNVGKPLQIGIGDCLKRARTSSYQSARGSPRPSRLFWRYSIRAERQKG